MRAKQAQDDEVQGAAPADQLRVIGKSRIGCIGCLGCVCHVATLSRWGYLHLMIAPDGDIQVMRLREKRDADLLARSHESANTRVWGWRPVCRRGADACAQAASVESADF